MKNSNSKKIRTRIAPSPTGEDLHIGNVYTGLINYAFARKNNGKFIIRLEDTDRARFVKTAEEKILSTLREFNLKYDEGPDIGGPFAPYKQSKRLEIYQKYAQQLIEQSYAYYCFCTKERLDQMREDQIAKKQQPKYDRYCLTHIQNPKQKIQEGKQYVVRLKIPDNTAIVFIDLLRGEIKIPSSEIDDQVLLKSDGYPTYHLGVVVDDYLMEISHIIRAEEWISSTPKHILLYKAFGWPLPTFAHVPILRNPDKSKLSKRKNPVWASWYLEQGFLPEAILNFLALLGWSHPEEKEIFSLSEFIQLFELKDLKPVAPIFDFKKLEWMNGEYIRQLSVDELNAKCKMQNAKLQFKIKNWDDPIIKKLIELSQSRIKTLNEFWDLVRPVLEDPEIKLADKEKGIAKKVQSQLSKLQAWNKDAILEALKKILVEEKIKMPVLYTIFTGKPNGLPLPEVLELLGKDKTLKKLSSM